MNFSETGKVIVRNVGRTRCSMGGEIWANILLRLIPDESGEEPGFKICLRVALSAPKATGNIPEHEAGGVYREVNLLLHELQRQMQVKQIEFPASTHGGLWPSALLDQLAGQFGGRARRYDV